MRKTFSQHFPLSEGELDSIYKNGLIVLDTNVLLQLYRYSVETTNVLFTVLETVQDRLWIPYQVGMEFFRNRLSVIAAMQKANTDLAADLSKALETLEAKDRHPFLPSYLYDKLKDACEASKTHLEAEADRYRSLLNTDDPIRERLANVLEERVGSASTA